jgi:hypothetical protein
MNLHYANSTVTENLETPELNAFIITDGIYTYRCLMLSKLCYLPFLGEMGGVTCEEAIPRPSPLICFCSSFFFNLIY